MKPPTASSQDDDDDSSSFALSRSSSSSSSVFSGASSSQSSSFSSFFYRGRIAHPKPNPADTQQQQPVSSSELLKAASFDPSSSSSHPIPARPVRSWPMRKPNDWNRLNTTSSSTLMSLSSSEDEEVDVFRLNPQQKQQREDRKVQRLVHLAKQQPTPLPKPGEIVVRTPARDRIIPAVAVKPILDIPVTTALPPQQQQQQGPVDIDTGYPWSDEVAEDDKSTASTIRSHVVATPILFQRDAASFESDETRRISNKTRALPWNPRDLEAAFGGSRTIPEGPNDEDHKQKSFWKRKSTLAALVAVLLLVIALVSLSMVFVGQMNKSNSSSSNNNNNNQKTKGIVYSPTSSPSARIFQLSHNVSSPSSSSPLNHTPPLHLQRPKATKSPTRPPSTAPTSAPSLEPTSAPSLEPTTSITAAVWQQVGQSLQGKEDKELLGSSLALSRNGQVLAVGSRNFTIGNVTQAGRVQVFEWNVSSWIPRGQVLLGLSPVAHFGTAVALNRAGTIVAVSEPTLGDGPLYRSGGVRIFQWNEARSVWIGIGEILGTNMYDHVGLSLALSGDGTRLVIGSPYHGSNKGQVRILDYRNGTTWELVTSLEGSSEGDWLGWDVALSEDGDLVCIGAPNNADHGGYVRCFKEGDNVTTWTQVGDDILNDHGVSTSDDFFGNSVSVSTWQGQRYVAVGAPFKSVNGAKVGFAAVYQLQQTETNSVVRQFYSMVGSPMFGTAANDQTGFVVRLLKGHFLVSSPGANREHGQVGFYRWNDTDWESRTIPLTSSNLATSAPQQDFGFALGVAQPDNQTLLMAVGAPITTLSAQDISVGAVQVYTTGL